MSYPSSIDSIPQPTATSPTNNPSAAGVSVAQTTAIEALETKLGIGASTPTSGTVLTGNGTGTSVWGATTGSGNVVLATSPTLVTPALGTPASGVATNLTGTASGLTAGNVTTNANLTGPITSSGNATSIASQTGTGSKFVVDTSPTIITPTIVRNANPVMSLNGNPVWQYLNSVSITSNQSTASTSFVEIPGMTVSVTIPTGYTKVRATLSGRDFYCTNLGQLAIFRGATSGTLTTQIGAILCNNSAGSTISIQQFDTPAAGSYYYTAAFTTGNISNAVNIDAGAGYPLTLILECC
jgi:hypothetical protein